MRSVRFALGGGLLILLVAIGLTLQQAPMTVLRTNGISKEAELVSTRGNASACQSGELLPAATSAIRLTLGAEIGPRVFITVLSGERAVTRGDRGDGWTGATVTVPVQQVTHTSHAASICFTVGPTLGYVGIFGKATPDAVALTSGAGEKLSGRIGVEYLRQGSESWLSRVPSIARRIGLGHAWPGTWSALMLLVAMGSSLALLCWTVLRELR